MAAYRSKRSLQRIYSLPRISQSNFYAAGHKDQTPPVDGFWSLTLYDAKHFFVPNEIKRYSLGTKNKTLKYNPDGSLTIYVQADPPPEAQRANWLPTPKNADFSLFMRAYWPKTAVIDGSWTPPAVQRIEGTVGRQWRMMKKEGLCPLLPQADIARMDACFGVQGGHHSWLSAP